MNRLTIVATSVLVLCLLRKHEPEPLRTDHVTNTIVALVAIRAREAGR